MADYGPAALAGRAAGVVMSMYGMGVPAASLPALQARDTSPPPITGKHEISPVLFLVLLAAVLWISALGVRRRARRRRSGAGGGGSRR